MKSKSFLSTFLLVLGLAFSSKAHSKILLAFVEVRDPHGRIVQLEHDGRFAHVAISVGSQWLQSHPYRGVELVTLSKLQEMGRVYTYTLSRHRTLNAGDVREFLGKPYDREFSWRDGSYYCSELIAKILGLVPEPMDFDARIWGPKYQKLKGHLGLSPDDIFRKLFVESMAREY